MHKSRSSGLVLALWPNIYVWCEMVSDYLNSTACKDYPSHFNAEYGIKLFYKVVHCFLLVRCRYALILLALDNSWWETGAFHCLFAQFFCSKQFIQILKSMTYSGLYEHHAVCSLAFHLIQMLSYNFCIVYKNAWTRRQVFLAILEICKFFLLWPPFIHCFSTHFGCFRQFIIFSWKACAL